MSYMSSRIEDSSLEAPEAVTLQAAEPTKTGEEMTEVAVLQKEKERKNRLKEKILKANRELADGKGVAFEYSSQATETALGMSKSTLDSIKRFLGSKKTRTAREEKDLRLYSFLLSSNYRDLFPPSEQEQEEAKKTGEAGLKEEIDKFVEIDTSQGAVEDLQGAFRVVGDMPIIGKKEAATEDHEPKTEPAAKEPEPLTSGPVQEGGGEEGDGVVSNKSEEPVGAPAKQDEGALATGETVAGFKVVKPEEVERGEFEVSEFWFKIGDRAVYQGKDWTITAYVGQDDYRINRARGFFEIGKPKIISEVVSRKILERAQLERGITHPIEVYENFAVGKKFKLILDELGTMGNFTITERSSLCFLGTWEVRGKEPEDRKKIHIKNFYASALRALDQKGKNEIPGPADVLRSEKPAVRPPIGGSRRSK